MDTPALHPRPPQGFLNGLRTQPVPPVRSLQSRRSQRSCLVQCPLLHGDRKNASRYGGVMGGSWDRPSPKADVEESRYRFGRHTMEGSDIIRVERNRTSHKIRHKKKLKKVSDRLGYGDGLRVTNPSKNSVNLAEYISNKNESVIVRNGNNTVNYYSDVIVKEKVDIHEHCYTTNEVLEIIAVTCLVNFIFWFLIISCVNFYTKKEKVKYTSWESLESAGIPSEYELRQHMRRYEEKSRIPGEDYADEEEELERNCLIQCDVSGEKLADVKLGKWTILEDFASERHMRRKSLISSQSMENLIF